MMDKKLCPIDGHGEMRFETFTTKKIFRDVEIEYQAEHFVCPVCRLTAASLEQTGKIQRLIADKYRKKVGLLTGEDIKKKRKELGLTQENLADELAVGIASIKRWEGGVVQSKSMDTLLKTFLLKQATYS